MAEASELKDELTVLGQHMHRFFVADRRPWAEVSGLSASEIAVLCGTRVRGSRGTRHSNRHFRYVRMSMLRQSCGRTGEQTRATFAGQTR